MRITPHDVDQIIQIFSSFIELQHATLYLYGSRVHDELKGGDIDLLLLTEQPFLANQLREKKHYILANLKNQIGDQKIDLMISDLDTANTDPFYQMILPKAIRLAHWPL